MCQYLAKYSGRTAELSEPLQQFTCKDTPFTWGPEHDEALKALKKEISATPTLRYYDPHNHSCSRQMKYSLANHKDSKSIGASLGH